MPGSANRKYRRPRRDKGDRQGNPLEQGHEQTQGHTTRRLEQQPGTIATTHEIGLDRKKRRPLETNCAYAWNITGRSRYGRQHTHTVSKECRKMRTWLWLVGLKKGSKPSKGMTTCLTKKWVAKCQRRHPCVGEPHHYINIWRKPGSAAI
jgi:hypothetical protein